jgi:hypothetical protein
MQRMENYELRMMDRQWAAVSFKTPLPGNYCVTPELLAKIDESGNLPDKGMEFFHESKKS